MYKNQILGLFIMLLIVTVLIIVITLELSQTKDTVTLNQVQRLDSQKEILDEINKTNSILTAILHK